MGIVRNVAAAAALVVSLFFAMPALAVTVPGLYSVEVPVESSNPNDLQKGYAEGLSRVFVRVSGSQDVLALDGVQPLLDDAESLLQSYQFLRSKENGNRLQMSFGAVGVNKALASIDAPVWGANRPLILAWIAVQSGGTRSLLVESEETADAPAPSDWNDAFMTAAENRGLPVALPPAGFAAQRELMSDIWGQFTSNVRDASEPLNHDLIALVRISQQGNEWRAGWVFDGMELGGAEESVSAADPQALASAVAGRWADTFARRYAVAGSDVGESPQVDIVLHGIDGIKDYAGLNRALKNLSPVVNAAPTSTKNRRVTVRVTFSGEIEQLKRYIALDPRLVSLSEAEVSRLPSDQTEQNAESRISGGADSAQNTASSSASGGAAESLDAPPDAFYAYDSASSTGQEEAEQAFESLYQVLHYRWQPASKVAGRGQEDTSESGN